MERVFTHDEATELLPRLTELLTSLVAAQRAAVEETAEHEYTAVASNGSAAARRNVDRSEGEVVNLHLGMLMPVPWRDTRPWT